MRDEDTPKSIPVAAVPPSSAPVNHQKHVFDGGRSTALSVAPDAHRSFTNRSLRKRHTLFGPQREKTCLRGFANNTGADQPAHPRSLISAFVIRFLESSIYRLATGEISIH